MNERDLKLLLDAHALKHIQIRYAVMADGKPLETTRRQTRQFKTLDTAVRFLFKMGIIDFAVKLT